jgi:hypothetical protein
MGVFVPFLDRVIALFSRRALGIGIVAPLLLGGCSTSFFPPDAPTQLDPGPADYQALVRSELNSMNRPSMGMIEISPPRKTRLAQPGDWMVCVRTIIEERPTYFAMFIREGRLVHRRLAVVIDECPQAQYQPLQGP